MTPPAVPFSCWPPQPYPALVPRRPLLPSEACSSSDKGCAGQTLSRAPQSCSVLTMRPPFPSTLTPFTCENTGSYLQFTGAMAHQPRQSESESPYMCGAEGRPVRREHLCGLNLYLYLSFISLPISCKIGRASCRERV